MGILAVVLGILAAVVAFFGTALFGNVGGIVAGVLGLIAIVLGFLKRKKDGKGGITGIVIGVLVIILAFSMASMWSNAFKELHNKAVEYMPESLWASVSDETDAGMMGIINKLPMDEASLNKLVDEMNQLNKIIDEKKD